MTDVATKAYTDMTLPPSVVTKIDVSHLVTELEKVNNCLTEATIRAQTTNAKVEQPQLSEQMNDFLAQNDLKIDESKTRDELIKQLHLLKDKVPIIHMTFAVTADPDSLHELAQWIRSSIDPRAVIEVGLQPSLVAGVYVRTPNHVHDLSLRAMLKNGRGKLVEELGALHGNR
jgi:F0F1-type ATP synthase delta subunit